MHLWLVCLCIGFLTDDLVVQEDGTHQKYLGVCKLAGDGHKVSLESRRRVRDL